MSDKESFLARWSRRKRETSVEPRDPATITEAAGATQPERPSESRTEPAFDVTVLPPIDSIGVGSDVRAFLAVGVPAELTRAALRRAWSSDPSIRDFVGLSENAWDFNAPDGVPGFGTLTVEDARRLLRRLTGEPEPAEPQDAVAVAEEPDAQTSDSGIKKAEADQRLSTPESDGDGIGSI